MSQRVFIISMMIEIMQWRMEIGNFSNYSAKHLKIRINKTKVPVHFNVQYFSYLLATFLSFLFCYVIMTLIMKTIDFCRVTVYLFIVEIPDSISKILFIIIRFYFSYILSIFVVYLLYHVRLIRLSSDIEVNPGPKPSSFKNFSICHWNLNSISSHDFLKVKLLTAYNALQKFDIVCISESYLNSEISSSNDNLNIPG